jgi:ArsR family transcriptional regulator, virulence genes transcriptional regulator
MNLQEENICAASSFLKGMASPHRLSILCALATEKECNVTTLIEITGLSQTSMSQHLLKLRSEGIIDYTRDHRELLYRITNPLAHDIMKVLYKAFCEPEEKSRSKKGKKRP